VSISQERLEGYRDALQENGIAYDESYVRYCQHGGMIQEETEEAVTQLIRLKKRPDAILTASDRLTTGCLSTLKKKALRIPEDILLVGFTNLHVVDLLQPALTSVRQPAYEIGHTATELLIQLIESKQPVVQYETRMLETELCIRDSSLKPA
jgi:LacI family transcriptional regulator